MAKRKKESKKARNKIFRKTAMRTRKVNVSVPNLRGGFYL